MLPKVPQSREEVSLPWLQEVLKQCPFEILDFTWNGMVGGGIGALSSLERITLSTLHEDGEVDNLSLVIKTPPSGNQQLRDFVMNEGFCQREFAMYTKVFPAWSKFQESRGTPSRYRFRSPTCLYAAEEGSGSDYNMILLLEDMDQSGWTPWSSGYKKGLKWAQAKHVIREMAYFHAVGMAYKEAMGLKHYTGPEFDFLFTHAKDEPLTAAYLRTGIASTCDMLRRSDSDTDTVSIPPGLISDLESFSDLRRLQELSFPRGERAGTIIHNDLHVYNVFFRSSSSSGGGGGGGASLLDFQMCSYASPMTDISFFLLISCHPSLFTSQLPTVLRTYAAHFQAAIRAMDMDDLVRYPIQSIVEDYHSTLLGSVVHMMMSSPQWCFGNLASKDTTSRYKLALLDSYARSGGRFSIESMEEFATYFESSSSTTEE